MKKLKILTVVNKKENISLKIYGDPVKIENIGSVDLYIGVER